MSYSLLQVISTTPGQILIIRVLEKSRYVHITLLDGKESYAPALLAAYCRYGRYCPVGPFWTTSEYITIRIHSYRHYEMRAEFEVLSVAPGKFAHSAHIYMKCFYCHICGGILTIFETCCLHIIFLVGLQQPL